MSRRNRFAMLLASAGTMIAPRSSQPTDTPPTLITAGMDAGDVTIQAAAGDGALPSFSGTAYNGGAMRPLGFTRDVYVDLEGCSVSPGQRPAHRDHDPSKVVGHLDDGQVEVGKRKIKVSGTISGTGADAIEVAGNSRNGFRWRLSLGARIERLEWVEEGQTAMVNGRRVDGGCYIVRACTIFEISFVSLGGDDTTSATVSATMEGFAMNFTQWLAARGHKIDDLTAAKLSELRAAYDAEQGRSSDGPTPPAAGAPNAGADSHSVNPPAPTGDLPALAAGSGDLPTTNRLQAAQAELEAERNRRDAERIQLEGARREICARFGDPRIKIEGQKDADEPLLVRATREGWDADRTELMCRRHSRPTGVTIHSPSIDDSNAPRTLEAALCMTAGISEESLGKDYDERTMNAALERPMRGASLKQLFCTAIVASGGHATPGRFDDETIRAALDTELKATSSSFSISGILSNVANKRMRAAYDAIADALTGRLLVWRSVSDFKDSSAYQLTVSGEWLEVGADGELKHGTLKEGSYKTAAQTRGMVIALTRVHIRNDDLAAFLQIPAGLARKSANKKQKVGFSVLKSMVTDSDFSVGNKNLISGATSALGLEGLTLGVQQLLKQVDDSGDPVGIMPRHLTVPSALSVVADDLYVETNVTVRLNASSKEKVMRNTHAGKYNPNPSVYLDAEHGGSDTGWYLSTDPEDIAVLDGVALDGRTTPILERGEADFSQLGMQFRAFDDWNVGKGDKKGALHSTGTA